MLVLLPLQDTAGTTLPAATLRLVLLLLLLLPKDPHMEYILRRPCKNQSKFFKALSRRVDRKEQTAQQDAAKGKLGRRNLL